MILKMIVSWEKLAIFIEKTLSRINSDSLDLEGGAV